MYKKFHNDIACTRYSAHKYIKICLHYEYDKNIILHLYAQYFKHLIYICNTIYLNILVMKHFDTSKLFQ